MEDAHTLVYYRLPSNAKLQLHIAAARADAERGLMRVRVVSTALRTRQLEVDEYTTAHQLKMRIEESIIRSEQVWYTADGFLQRRVGGTVLVNASAKADAKLGTSVVRLGDELLVEDIARLGGGKGPLSAFRVLSGRPVVVEERHLVVLELPPQKQNISFRGRVLQQGEQLWGAGVRNDDTIMLEFASPVMPRALQILRAPPVEKARRGKAKKGDGEKKSPKRGAKK